MASKVLSLKHSLNKGFCNNSLSLSVRPAVNGHLTLFRAGEGGEEEEGRPTSVTPLPVQIDSLSATS